MMLQFTYDSTRKAIGVFLPIDDWNLLKQIPGVDEVSQENFAIPTWQVKLGKKELQLIANASAGLMEWIKLKTNLYLSH